MLNSIYKNLHKPPDYGHQNSFLSIRLEVNCLSKIEALINRSFL